jgi:low affinity Fe/Cu permease
MAKEKERKGFGRTLESFSQQVAKRTGGSWAFVVALTVIVIWAATGPIFRFSDTWQLVINTGTTIVTFLMVFLIQRVQNKESLSIQLKLDEIIAALKGASNRLIDIEDVGEEEIERLHEHYKRLGHLLEQRGEIDGSHSVEEEQHRRKSVGKR